jgi:hypothetical protein
MARNTLIQVRRGDSVSWSGVNPVLNAGEWGFDTARERYKIGDGLTAWNSLPWASIRPVEDDIVGSSGIVVDLAPTSTGVPIVNIRVGSIVSSQVSNFNSSVSGLLPSISGVSGVKVDFSSGQNAYTVSLSDPQVDADDIIGLGEAVDDRVNSLLVAGSNIQLTYLDNNNETSSLTIAVTGVSLADHTHVWSDVTDASATATLNELAYLSGVVAGTVSSSRAVVVDGDKDVAGIRNLTTDGNVTVGGDLVVHGTSTTVNSTEVDIGDNIITVNTSGLPTGGFRVFRGGDAANDANYKSLIWNNTLGQWEFSGPKIVTTGNIVANCIEVTCTGVVSNLNSDKLDDQDGSYYLDWVNTTNKPTITGILTGDVAGTGSITLGNAGGTISIATTVQPNSVALGTDTTGQYASTVSVAGTGLSATPANADDGTAYTITLNSTPANIPSGVVVRDATGSFTATNITASGFIGNGSSLTDLNASNISTGTLDSARLPSVSQTNTTVGPSGTFVSSVSVDSYGRVTGVNRTTHTLATTSVQGIASFNTNDFSVNSGAVSVKVSGISNTQLENDSITIGQTELVLGQTYSAISGVSNSNPVVLTFFAIDGGTP